METCVREPKSLEMSQVNVQQFRDRVAYVFSSRFRALVDPTIDLDEMLNEPDKMV